MITHYHKKNGNGSVSMWTRKGFDRADPVRTHRLWKQIQSHINLKIPCTNENSAHISNTLILVSFLKHLTSFLLAQLHYDCFSSQNKYRMFN